MEGRQELTKEQRGAIIYGYQLKHTVRSIADHVGCSKTAMSNTIKRFQQTGCTDPQGIRTGRPSLIQAPSRSLLKNIVITNRRLNTSQITNTFIAKTNLHVSKSTVR